MDNLNYANAGTRRGIPPTLIVIGIVALFVLALGLTLWFRMQQPNAGWGGMAAAVKTAPVVVRDLPITYETVGTLEANRQVDFNFEIPGVIQKIYAREGDWVAAGQPLLRMDADKQMADVAATRANVVESEASLKAYRSEVSAANAGLQAAQSKQKLAEAEYKRYRDLWQKQFVSTQAVDERASALEVAQANVAVAMDQKAVTQARLNQAQAGIVGAEARYSQSRYNRQDTLLKAPFAGRIGTKIVEVGDYVLPTEKVMTLIQADPLKVMFQVPEEYLNSLKTGLAVYAKTDSDPGHTYHGNVVFLDPQVSTTTRGVTVKAHIDNGAHQLQSGQFARVGIVLGHKQNAMTIPEEALIPQGERYFVYVVRKVEVAQPDKSKVSEDHAFFTQVFVGQRQPGRVEITKGILPKDRVIVAGIQKVQDNMAVKELPDTAAKPAAAKKESH